MQAIVSLADILGFLHFGAQGRTGKSISRSSIITNNWTIKSFLLTFLWIIIGNAVVGKTDFDPFCFQSRENFQIRLTKIF